jgi:methionine aminotransferase
MASGISDFECPPELVGLLADSATCGHNNFVDPDGLPALREAISAALLPLTGRTYNPVTEITVTAGTVQAVHTAISALVGDDDEVIIFEPAAVTLAPSVLRNNGRPVYIQMKPPLFTIDWDEVRRAINPKTKLIILDSPHNPTGALLTDDDMQQLQKLTNGARIQLLSIEADSALVYDSLKYQSVVRFGKLADRSLTVSSCDRLYNISGLGIAFCAGPAKMMSDFRYVQEYQLHCANVPAQYALTQLLRHSYPADEVVELYMGKRNYFSRLMAKSPFKLLPVQGGCFQLLDYSRVSSESDVAFVRRLIAEAGVAMMPVSVFYHERTKQKLLRLCFARENSVLEEVAARLSRIA